MFRLSNIARAIIVGCAMLAIQGCASSGPRFSEMPLAQQGPKPDMARIYVYRTTILGAAVQPDVTLNGQAVGTAVPNGFFYLDRPAGEYKIATETEVERTLNLTLEPGQTAYVRLGISMGFFVGHVYPELVENSQGSKEVQECHFTGPTP